MKKERFFIKRDFRTADVWLYTTDFSIGEMAFNNDETSDETDSAIYLNGGYTGSIHEWVPKKDLFEIVSEVFDDLMRREKEAYEGQFYSTYTKENLNEDIQTVLKDADIVL